MKKGFTLVELLAVLVILSFLTLLIVTVVTNQMNDGQSEVYQEQLTTIKLAAEMWGSSNKTILKKMDSCITLTLGYLKEEGLVDDDIKNAKSGKKLDDDNIYVNIEKKNKTFKYTIYDEDNHKCSVVY